MGYSYETISGKLCCDSCGKSGGVRKKNCPFGWCPADALCAECRADASVIAVTSKAAHRERGCEKAANDMRKREEYAQILLDEGKYLRCSAIGVDDTGVLVTFRNKDGDTLEKLVTKDSYRSIPILAPATPDYFREVS